jgi:hypothetical protein
MCLILLGFDFGMVSALYPYESEDYRMKVITTVRANEYQLVGKRVELACSSIENASKVFRDFIESNDFGASNCAEAFVKDGRKILARVSYNGKVWEFDGTIHNYDSAKLLFNPFKKETLEERFIKHKRECEQLSVPHLNFEEWKEQLTKERMR